MFKCNRVRKLNGKYDTKRRSRRSVILVTGELLLAELPVAIASTYCAYPRRDGQAELIWVTGYILR